MDFTFTDEQQAVASLAAQILGDPLGCGPVAEVERSADRVDRDLWSALAAAGLVGIALPEAYGGAGLGVTELCLVLEQQGRRVAPVPLLWTALAAMAIAAFGRPDAAAAWLPGVVNGRTVLTCALAEPGAGDPWCPSVDATPDADGGWRLHGERLCVPYAHVAEAVLTPARVAGTEALVMLLVDPAAAVVPRRPRGGVVDAAVRVAAPALDPRRLVPARVRRPARLRPQLPRRSGGSPDRLGARLLGPHRLAAIPVT